MDPYPKMDALSIYFDSITIKKTLVYQWKTSFCRIEYDPIQ